MTDLARKWSNSLGLRNDQKAPIQKSHEVLESASPTHEGQTWSPRWVEGQSRDPQSQERWRAMLSVDELKNTPHRARRRGCVPAWPQLWVEQKKKTLPLPILISDLDFYEFGVWTYRTIVAERNLWKLIKLVPSWWSA